jgi:hypothetical protein
LGLHVVVGLGRGVAVRGQLEIERVTAGSAKSVLIAVALLHGQLTTS